MNALASLADFDTDQAAKTELHADGSPRADALKQAPPEYVQKLQKWVASKNIALEEDEDGNPEIGDDELLTLGMQVKRDFDIDENSMAEWAEEARKALDMATQKVQQKQYPWPKASNVVWPLMTTAAFQFAARAYPAIIPGPQVVKGVVIGSDEGVPVMGPNGQQATDPTTGALLWKKGPDGRPQVPGAKRDLADRIGEHMSYQLLDEQEEWEPETDQALHQLPVIGCFYRKSYFDTERKHNASLVVSALNLVVNYKAKSLERAPRVSEKISFYPNEIAEKERAGIFRKIAYTHSAAPETDQGDEDAPVEFIEQHRWWDFDGDGLKEPYIVTIEKASGQVVRVVSRYEVDGIQWNFTKGEIVRIEPVHYYTKYDFFPNLEGGLLGFGFGHLLRSLNESINTTINMMLDAGHLQVVGGGFIGKGLSMSAGAMRFQPGEWKPVNAVGGTIKDSMVPLNAPGPSLVLFQLLGMLVEAGKEVAAIKDVLTGESVAANTPATTMLAMVEQGLKAFTAIYKRVHRSLKAELAKLARLNSLYLNQDTQYKVGDVWKTISQADYQKGTGVEPISDPNMVTDMQKLGRANLLMMFKDDPLMDHKKIRERVLDAAQIDKPEELFNPNPPPNPAVVVKMLEAQNEKRKLDIQQQHNEAQLQLRARHDGALIAGEEAKALLSRASAINQIAQAVKAIGSAEVGWVEQQIDLLRVQMEQAANAATDTTAAAEEPFTEPAPNPQSDQQAQGAPA